MIRSIKINQKLKYFFKLTLFQVLSFSAIYCQVHKSIFRQYIDKEIPDNYYGEILISRDGKVLVSGSEFSFVLITGGNVGSFTFGLDNQNYGIKNLKSVFTGSPIKNLTESTDGNIFFATAENQVTYFKNTETGICDLPPFYFPVKGDPPKEITRLWFDKENNLYIGVAHGGFYLVPKAGTNNSLDTKNYKIGRNPDSSMNIMKGELAVKKIPTNGNAGVYSFSEDRVNKNIIWLGTDAGLFYYNKINGQVNKILTVQGKITITHIETFGNGDIWFSTLEKGMGVYHQITNTVEFFSYLEKQKKESDLYPIQGFCIKSANDFFVAVKDSVPAIFDTQNKSYTFIDDSSFVLSRNSTTDIKLDSTGIFYFIKGGLLYSANLSDKPEWIGDDSAKITYTPIIYGVTDFNKREITNFLTKPEWLRKLKLKYNENSIIIYITSNYYSQKRKIQYAWRLDGDVNNWVDLPTYDSDNDSSTKVELPDIKPGKYNFRVRIKVGDGEWSTKEAQMNIIVTPPYWATWSFWAGMVLALLLTFYITIKLRVNAVKTKERQRAKYEKDLLELEAKALRAQMNPHFIFNCMNSIKSLMQEKEIEKGVTYLTTFSKLIRTLFNNADKKEISLYDEIETCKLYLQLEAMRFDAKFSYLVKVDEHIDLKSVQVPALIIQPFIENAIWHGIVPKGANGHVELSVEQKDHSVEIVIDDNGIGRESSRQNKSASDLVHQSKGVNLTQSRLKLDNLLQQRQAELEMIDKKDENGASKGTRVIIRINEEIT